jgi:hypothetical protein
MNRPADRSVRAQVEAGAPLLRVGLEQAALAAGLQLTSSDASAVIGLRSPDAPPTGATVDVSVEANFVRITLTAVPDRRTWMSIWSLLGQLFDAANESP